jgi:DNA repair protein RecN (Recombination protein N)
MLEEMRIRDLGVIADALLDFAPGLTVLTGETGAGKTMVLTGLGLLLGGRSDAARVRAGAERAVVEGRFDPPPAAAARVAEAGGDLDEDGTLLVGRSVTAAGRSRATCGGQAVPVAVLTELGESLVAVHGQSDQQRLLRPSRQREALDRYAGADLTALLVTYREAYGQVRSLRREITRLQAEAGARAAEREGLARLVDACERLDPAPGEDVALRQAIARQSNAEALEVAARRAHDLLSGSAADAAAPDVRLLLDQARRAVAAESGQDASLQALEQRLTELAVLAADLAGDLASYAEGIESDPESLSAAQERLAALVTCARRAGVTDRADADGASVADALLAWSEQASRRLLELDDDADAVDRLRGEEEAATAGLLAAGTELSRLRRASAGELGRAVAAELAALSMPHARLEVLVTARPAGAGDGAPTFELDGVPVAAGPDGFDEVALLLAAHAGAEPLPLARGASGGELSRVMLALEVVLAGSDPVGTMVFDEVDAGVGGRAAVEIGRRLALLARDTQVVCVTHLPQVAAFADRHLVVRKSDDGRITSSGVVAVDGEERIEETSRMLSGLDGSQSARSHARELLETARALREQPTAADRRTPRRVTAATS